MNVQKLGGVTALVAAATFLFGFALFATVLAPYALGTLSPEESVAFLAEHEAIMYTWYLVIYVVFGGALVVLTLALYERLKADSPAAAPLAAAFGLIWAGLMFASGMVANVGSSHVIALFEDGSAQAVPVWLSLDFVINGLGGGNEIVGGLWVLLLSIGALRAGDLPRALNYLGVVIGVAGLVTVVPALTDVGAVFGLGLIVWFVWVGVVLLRSHQRRTQSASIRKPRSAQSH